MKIATLKSFLRNLSHLPTYLSSRNASILVLSGVATYIAILTLLGFEKHLAFKTSAWDLGSFDQAFSSTVSQHGFFTYNLEPYTNPGGSFFGIHFSPLLLTLLPIYAIAPSIITLLVLQATAIALGAVPVYKLALLKKTSISTAVAFSASYLLYYPILAANLFDFHMESFLVAPILFSIYFLTKQRWRWFAVSILIALSSIEYSVFLVATLGLSYLSLNFHTLVESLREKKYFAPIIIVPVTLVVSAVAWFIVATSVITIFNPSPPKAFTGAENWNVLGANTIVEIPVYAILNPIRAIKALSFDATLKLVFVVAILVPLLFLPLLQPRALILASPWPIFAALSNYLPYYQIGFQYVMFIVPGLFWALLLGVENLGKFVCGRRKTSALFRHSSRYVMVCCLITSILFVTVSSPVILARQGDQHIQYLDRIIQLVPPTASVLTQNNIFPHFSSRSNAYVIPVDFPWLRNVFPAIVDAAFGKNPDFVLIDGSYDPQAASIASVWLRGHGGYGLYASADWIILLKRGFVQAPVFFEPLQIFLDHGSLNLYQGLVVRDPSSPTGLPIVHPASSNSSVWFDSSQTMILPSGAYNASLDLKSSRTFTGNAMTIQVFGGNTTVLLDSFRMDGSNFLQSNRWVSIGLQFKLSYPEVFRISGRNVTASSDIYLDSIQIIQTE